MQNGNNGNIVLIGMPGSGKSSCGVLAAKALLMEFVDTDLLLQKSEKAPLQKIIDAFGPDYFLRAEGQLLQSLRVQNCVIATGGSAVFSESGVRHLAHGGKIVFLHITYAEMCRRINNISTRGVVRKGGETLEEMFSERLPLYRRMADAVIDCTGLSPEDTVKEIVLAAKK